MRELWLKTFELFRRHPVLWAPYVCAELLAFSLLTLRRMAYKPILYWFARTTSKSALGGQSTTYDFRAGQHKAVITGGLLDWATRYLNACLLTAALVATTLVLAALLQGRMPEWMDILRTIRAQANRIMVYALKFCALMLAATAIVFGPMLSFDFHPQPGKLTYYLFLIGVPLLLTAIVAWIMTPVAMRLLCVLESPPVTAERRKLGRYFALIVILVSFSFQFAAQRAATHITLQSRISVTAFGAFTDLLINIPILFLFIALALLALESPLTAGSAAEFHLPQSIKNMMPLHYPPADESK